ncbi:MAG: hypothetical protein H6739_02605 [Alphaproteobacteria bacterium]|nr:hypothetical protein [Alphaproteobacteria bacterium]
MFTLAILASLSAPALADTYPPEAVIQNAASVQISTEGLDAITEMLPAVVPAEMELGDVGDDVDGNVDGWCWLDGGESGFKLEDGIVHIELGDARITPTNGALSLEINAMIGVNDSSRKLHFIIEEGCFGTDCTGWIDPFPVTLSTSIALEVVTGDTGDPMLDATVGDLAVDMDNEDLADAVNLGDCGLGTIWDILDFLTLGDDVLSLIPIEDMLADLGPEIETTIEDAFNQAVINEEMDINGVPLTVQLFPNDVNVTTDGVEILMSGSTSAPPADCVVAWDPGGSTRTDSAVPALAELSAGDHAAILLSDDFANQALYSLWRGGLLCYELSGNDPLPINTSLIGLLAGDAFDELFPETKPMIIATRPRAPLEVAFDGEHAIDVPITDLGLNLYAEVDDRMALALGLSLDGVVGVDPVFDGNTGELGIDLALSGENITASVIHNELVTGTDEAIEENFAGVFDTLLETLIGGLISDLAFAIPGFGEVGLTSLTVDQAGDQGDWMGAYANVGPITYGGGDCGGCGGEGGGSDCSGGCASGHAPAHAFWFVLPLALVGLRRRE